MFDPLRRTRHYNRPFNPPPTTFEIVSIALAVGVALVVFLWAFLRPAGAAEAATTTCPTPGEPCKILVITPMEEQMLIKQGGILDTAQAGRYIDLGNVVAYFRMKLANAPAGEMKAVPKPAEPKGNPSLGAGPANPAAKGGDAP